MKVLVAGATGFVGRHVVDALLAAGVQVVGGTRSPERAALARPEIDWVRLDVADADTVERACEGVDALVYLVHHMRAHGDDLLAQERASALRVRRAAERAGVRRIVYLGGPVPAGEPSEHLAARLATGEVLRGGSVSTLELQAAMIIGAGSESWLIVRDLARRLPVMVLPQWLKRRSQPIGIDDVARAIVRAVELEHSGSRVLPLPGPETLSATQILYRVAAASGVKPLAVSVPVLTPSLSSHWIRLVTRADYDVARQLVDGLTCDLVAEEPTFWSVCTDCEPTPLDAVIRKALDDEPQDAMPAWQWRWEALVCRFGRASSTHS